MGHVGSTQTHRFSPDGNLFASISGQTVHVWSVPGGKHRHTRFKDGPLVDDLAFSSDGRTLVTGQTGGWIRLWNTKTGKEYPPPAGHHGPVKAAAFSPDGKTLYTASATNNEDWPWQEVPGGRSLHQWEVSSGKEKRRFDTNPNYVTSLAVSPDGRWIATGEYYATYNGRSSGNFAELQSNDTCPIHLRHTSTGEIVTTINAYKDWISDIAFTADGKAIVVASTDKTVSIWDVPSGKERHRVTVAKGRGYPVAVFADG